jgi:uncharacterized protein (DUF2141 family)
MRSLSLLFALALLAACSSTSPVSVNTVAGPPTNLTVEITDVTNTDGQMLVLLFDNSADYHSDKNVNDLDAHFFRKLIVTPQTPTTTVTFEGVPAGQYAIHVIHDEDGDGGMDRMIFPFTGMPSEPYALSNNIHDSFSKGDFEEALFTVKAPDTKIQLALSTHLSKMTGL